MRAVVVGAGEVGYHVAERLSTEKHDVVVVDVRPERLEYVQTRLDVAVVEGSGASPSVLEMAGIRDVGLLAAVTSVDEVNLVCCMSVRGGDHLVKVARVSNPDFYADGAHLRPELFGVDVMINPERELALETLRLLEATEATDIATFAGGAVQLVGLKVTDEAPIAGRTFAEIGADIGNAPMLTVALKRGDRTIVPKGTTAVKSGDHLYVVATESTMPTSLELCGYRTTEVRRVMIAGGSLEAYYLAQLLHQHRGQAIMLIKERDRAQDLAAKLDQALILNGDATDLELLEVEGVSGVSAFVALTDHDEINILSALLAKHAGARQVVTLVNRMDYMPLARMIGLETVVSPRLSAANAILRYVRRGSVTKVATFKDSEAEAIAFNVSAASPLVGLRLAEVDFPEGAIVAALVRETESGAIVPRGDDKLLVGDQAVVFALPEAVGPVAELFPS
ncbi:MAG: Trk system potassium transporter TrkA [Gemmatimonadota bacterium]|nr:MAG: Trk system potassium transporter TrkA [Gemmatimonadota bacterium]